MSGWRGRLAGMDEHIMDEHIEVESGELLVTVGTTKR